MANLVKPVGPDGWLSIEGVTTLTYCCQTRIKNWWSRICGIASVHDVGEAETTHPTKRVPVEVLALADRVCPGRVK